MTERIVDVLGQWSLRPGPLHARLAGAIRDAVGRGALGNGTRLPAERALARMLSVSRSTVAAAYAALARDGILEGRQGSGTYVRSRVGQAPSLPSMPIRVPRALAIGSFDLAGEALELTSATVGPEGVITAELAAAALSDPVIRDGHGYAPFGIPSLRAAVAEHLTAAGLATGVEQVLITSGAQQALVLAAALLARRGDRVVVEHATFPGLLDAIAATGARLATAPLDGEGVRVDGLRAIAEEQGARAAFVIPSFHNPTGTVLPASRRQALVELASELELALVEDGTIADLWLEQAPPPPLAAFAPPEARILTVGSMSKLAWGGLRVGWIRGSEATISQLVALKVVADLGSSVVSQAIAALLLPRAEELRVLRRRQIGEGLSTLESCLAAELPEWEYVRPSGGVALWVKLPYGDAEELAQVALRHGVVVLPGTTASAGGEHRDRLRLPLVREPEVLAEGVRRLAAAWRAYVPAREAARPRVSVVV